MSEIKHVNETSNLDLYREIFLKAEKELFLYDKNNFKKFYNIQICCNKLINDSEVFKNFTDKLWYPSIIKAENNFFLFARSNKKFYKNETLTNSYHDEITIVSQSKNTLIFDKTKIILKGNSACHNIGFFLDHNKKSIFFNHIIGIGGKHKFRSIIETKHEANCIKTCQFIDYEVNFQQARLASKYPKILENNKYAMEIIDPKKFNPCYANGLHLFYFDENFIFENLNLNNLKLYQNIPIISGINNDDNCDDMYGLGVFDGANDIVFFNNKYFLYSRCNPITGKRFVKYAISDDLINWSNFKIINVMNDNYKSNKHLIYSTSVKNYKDFLISLSGSFVTDDNGFVIKGGIFLMISIDGINWNPVDFLIDFKIPGKHKISSFIHSYIGLCALGDILYGDNYLYFYIHFPKSNKLIRYKVKNDKFIYITSDKKNKISSFITKKIKVHNKNIKINYDIENDGYIMLEFLDNEEKIIFEYKIIKNNKNNIIIPNDIDIDSISFINCSFFKSKIYSFINISLI